MAERISGERLTIMALLTLEGVAVQASKGTVPRAWSTRLALAYLVEVGADRAGCLEFWQHIASPFESQASPEMSNYCRATSARTALARIYRSVGVQRSVEIEELGRDGKITPSTWKRSG